MLNKDLVIVLQKLNPEAKVVVMSSDNEGANLQDWEITEVHDRWCIEVDHDQVSIEIDFDQRQA